MTPVDAVNTVLGRQGNRSATASIVRAMASRPAFPVKALAFPALTRSALAMPPWRALRHQSTGGEGVSDRVRTPATWVPCASSASKTSRRP